VRDFLFMPHGRTRRRAFVLTFIPVMTLGFLIGSALPPLELPSTIFMVWVGGVALAKRFQDRGWPGKVIGVSWMASCAVVWVAIGVEMGLERDSNLASDIFTFFVLGTLVMMFPAIFFNGTDGDNKYGPDPRAVTGPVTEEDKEFWDKPPI
jgi:uncharacterized membrane protein YhaH (DUF805 family)